MKALIIVDLQNDFFPGGALPAPEAEHVVPVINDLMKKFKLVIASRDMHPSETDHFEKWPPHCVEGTIGAMFHPDLDTSGIAKEVQKGTGSKDDGYSAFEATNVNLEEYLLRNQVSDVYIAGLTTEYCIKNTALDASRNGFETWLISDAVSAVEPDSENERNAIEQMEKEDIHIIDSSMLQ